MRWNYIEYLPFLVECFNYYYPDHNHHHVKQQTSPTAHLKHQLTRQVAVCRCLGSVPVKVHKELSWQEGQGTSSLNVIAGHIAKDVALGELPFSRGGLLESKFGQEMKELVSHPPLPLDVKSMGMRHNTQ